MSDERKEEAVWLLLRERWAGVPMDQHDLARSIVELWSELKAVMEPTPILRHNSTAHDAVQCPCHSCVAYRRDFKIGDRDATP
jgi:hypothetical protein